MNLSIIDFLRNEFGLSEEQAYLVSPLFEARELLKGDFFLKEQSYAKELAFMINGITRIWTQTYNREVTQWIATEGYVITDLQSFIFGTPSRFQIEALSPCCIYVISKQNYDQIPSLVNNWPAIERHFLVHCFTNLENRVTQFLSMNAEERYTIFFESNKEIFNQVPLQYIASMLGMTPETFSRIRKKQIS